MTFTVQHADPLTTNRLFEIDCLRAENEQLRKELKQQTEMNSRLLDLINRLSTFYQAASA